MKFDFLVLACLLCLGGLAGCSPMFTPSSLPTDTPPPPTDTPTPTIVWFPPTATSTRLPTATLSITPTLDTRPVFGGLVLSDDFSDPAMWSLGKAPVGNIALSINELNLAVTQARGYLFSLRQSPILDDFYAEITANPSICRGQDEYGLLLRVSPSLNFFRFALTCDGHASVDRFLDGVASSPQPPILSGAVPPGAPSSSRLGVWARGKELRFYANGQYLFSFRDPSIPAGGLGVFVRAAGEDLVSVNFSNLEVYEVK
jgi:hypothetical protein